MTQRIMSEADHERIAAAIRSAEGRTSGEIYCVVARSSGSYFAPAAFMLSAAIILIGPLAAWVPRSWWIDVSAVTVAAAQVLALVAAIGVLLAFPALRIHFVPRGMRYAHAKANATRQFLSRNIHVTSERTGVLIFVSMAERYAEIIADAGINQKVAAGTWDRIVLAVVDDTRAGRLADGFVKAVGAVGTVLSENFPARAAEQNELDDHVAEI